MSTAPNNSADLGSAHSTVEWVYNRTAFAQYIADITQAETLQGRLAAAMQTAQQVSKSPAPATAQQAQTAARAIQAQVRESDRLAQAEIRLATANRDYASALGVVRRQLQTVGNDRAKELNLLTQEIKLTQQLEKERRNVASVPSGPPVLPRSFAGFTSAGLGQVAGLAAGAFSVQAITSYTEQAFKLRAGLLETRQSVGTLLGDVQRGNAVFAEGAAFARKYGFTQREIGEAVRSSAEILKRSSASLQQVLTLQAKLQAKSPEQDAAEASIAIKGFLDGDIQSLTTRFELSRSDLAKLRKELEKGADPVLLLDEYMTSLGYTNEILADRTKGAAGEIRRFAQSQEDLALAVGSFTEGPGVKLLDFFSAVLDGVTKIFSGRDPLDGGAGGSQFVARLLPKAGDLNELKAELEKSKQQIIKTYGDSPEVQAAISQLDALIQGLTASQFDYLKGLTATEAAQTLYGRGFAQNAEVVQQATSELDLAVIKNGDAFSETSTRTNELKSRISELGGVMPEIAIAALDLARKYGDDAISAEEYNKQLAYLLQLTSPATQEMYRQADALDAATRGAIKATAATKQLAEANEDLEKNQKAFGDALIKASDGIGDALKKRNDALDDADKKLAEQQRVARDRLGEIEQQRSDAIKEAVAKGGDERAKIVAEQNKRNLEREQEYQLQLIAEQRSAQIAQYRSTADFLERLYGLTRGRRNKKALEEDLNALRAAQAEAKQLVDETGDAGAGASLLAERQRQIVERRERVKTEAQLRRDAKRGAGLDPAGAKEEVDAIRAIQDQADQATIDGIKAGAQEKKQDRQRNLDDAKAADKQQLDDFDKAQGERLRAINDGAAKQQQAVEKQLADQKLAYEQQQAEIRQGYTTFVEDTISELNRLANEINLLPDDARKKELADAQYELGLVVGQSLARGYNDALQGIQFTLPGYGGTAPNIPGVNAPGGATTSLVGGNRYRTSIRGGAVNAQDQALTAGAIDRIVAGGRQTDSFSSGRNIGGKQSDHGGVDIAAAPGSPVKTPVAGKVVENYFGKTEGNAVIIVGDDGGRYLFGHFADRSPVAVGTRVKAGDVIGSVGSSGAATGPHVHFQKRAGGQLVDPTAQLNALANATVAAPRTSVSPSAGTGNAGRDDRIGALSIGGGGTFRGGQGGPTERWIDRMADSTLIGRPIGPAQGSSYVDDHSVHIHNPTFGPGVQEAEVREWFKKLSTEEAASAKRDWDAQMRTLSSSGGRG